MSREPWNTRAAGKAGCEDMPRKSLDIRFTEKYSATGKGPHCVLSLDCHVINLHIHH